MTFIKNAVLLLFLLTIFAIPLAHAKNLSTELTKLEDQYRNLNSFINNPNLIILSRETQSRFSLEQQIVPLHILVTSLVESGIKNYKNGISNGMWSAVISTLLIFSNEEKKYLKEKDLKEIGRKIDALKQEIAQQSNEIFPSNSQQNNSSFAGALEKITSDEHLTALSIDNILAQNNGGGSGTAIQNTENFSPSPYDCGGILTEDYRGRLYSQFLKPKMDNWGNRRWSNSSRAVGSSLKTQRPQYQINLPRWEQRVNCIDDCTAKEFKYEADWAKCKTPCYTNTKFKKCKEY